MAPCQVVRKVTRVHQHQVAVAQRGGFRHNFFDRLIATVEAIAYSKR
jgi:hypothetical protein